MAAIITGAPLLAPAQEGLHSAELANAMILSSAREKTVALPMDPAEYTALSDELIAKSPRKNRGAVINATPGLVFGAGGGKCFP